MALLSTMLGFSAFGVVARMSALSIQRRPIYDWPIGHVLTAVAFAGVGYGANYWDERSTVILAEKRAELAARRQRTIERAEAQGNALLAEH